MKLSNCKRTRPLWADRLLILAVTVFIAMSAAAASAAAQSGGGALHVTSFPAGAKVFIDGADTGKTTPMSTSLTVGDHNVEVSVARLRMGTRVPLRHDRLRT
jgi:hypothetical protein